MKLGEFFKIKNCAVYDDFHGAICTQVKRLCIRKYHEKTQNISHK